MRTIIAGSRHCMNYNELLQAIDQIDWGPSVIISGTASGADTLGEHWADDHSIPIERFPANWDEFGKSAGYIRNAEMVLNADALIALWDGKSRGTQHMIEVAERQGLRVFIWMIE